MSTPLCLAHAMGTPRLSELHRIDEYHYIGEENFLKNYSYITHHHNQSYFTDNIRDFINL
jgi:hypothetical protein